MHPLENRNSKHYRLWENKEVIEAIEGILTIDELIAACKFNILQYRFRIGKKDDYVSDMEKIQTYEYYLEYLYKLKKERASNVSEN